MSDFVVQLLISLGVGSALAPLIAALFNRGKTKAESQQLSANATQVIAQAASEVAKNYQTMNKSISDELVETKDELKQCKDDLKESQRVLDETTDTLIRTNQLFQATTSRLIQAVDILESLGHDVGDLRPPIANGGG